MTKNIKLPANEESLKKYYQQIEKFQELESKYVLSLLNEIRSSREMPNNNSFRIIFDETDNKVCCNDKCYIF